MRMGSLGIIALSLLLSACGKATPVPLPPEEIVLDTIARLQETSGFHFVIERSGAPAFLDVDHSISIRRMEGDFMAPDRVQAEVRIIAPGLVTELEVIGIGDTQWQTSILSGEWQQLPPEWGFNPSIFFDANSGLLPILEADLVDLEWIGNVELEDAPGTLLYALSGRVQGGRIYELTYGLIGPQALEVTMWIVPETFELFRMLIVDQKQGEEEATLWTLDFWEYDQYIDIQPPLSNEIVSQRGFP
jgi:hypothetical protein